MPFGSSLSGNGTPWSDQGVGRLTGKAGYSPVLPRVSCRVLPVDGCVLPGRPFQERGWFVMLRPAVSEGPCICARMRSYFLVQERYASTADGPLPQADPA